MVRRLVVVLLVGFLTAATGGVLDLVVPEYCTLSESASTAADGTCAATCVRCHCAFAFDLVVDLAASDALLVSPEWLTPFTGIPQHFPHDILHVPKRALG